MSEEIIFPKLGGYVTDPKDFIGTYNNKRENPKGLFSEQIFGPKNDYQCSCKKLIGPANDNKVCENCGVICSSGELRHSQFGRIKTIYPFVKPTKKKKLVKILGNLSNVLINPDRKEVNLDNKKYIALKKDKTTIKLVDSLNCKDCLVIPFRITGIYSLYVVLKFLAENMNISKAQEIFEENCISYDLKVLPPNLRMYSFDSNKNQLRNSPINKLYTSILNLNRLNTPYVENLKNDSEEWQEKIKIHLKDRILDQDIVEDTIFNYDSQSFSYQRNINNIYQSVYNDLSGKFGLIRNLILGRIIEFSARAVITVDPSLEPYQIGVSKNILKTLWMPYFIHYLTEYKDYDYTYCFENYMLNVDEDEFSQLFDEFLKWFYK